MTIDAGKYKSIAQVAMQIATAAKRRDSLHVVATISMTEAQRGKHVSQVETLSEYIEERHHELHCLCVEADLATPEPERYGERVIKSGNGWHDLKINRRKPDE